MSTNDLTDQMSTPTMESGQTTAGSTSLAMQTASPTRRARRTLPLLLTLLAVLCVALTGAWASTAMLHDEVSLVALRAHGGTLDLGVIFEDSFTVDGSALDGVLPGTTATSRFSVTDTGSVPADIAVVVTELVGAAPAGCFDYALVDGAVVHPITSVGTIALGSIQPGIGHSRDLGLRVTNRADCTVNGAVGGITAKVTAVQQGAS